MSKLKDLLFEKNFALRETIEDFDQERITFLMYLHRVKTIAEEVTSILDHWDYLLKDQ